MTDEWDDPDGIELEDSKDSSKRLEGYQALGALMVLFSLVLIPAVIIAAFITGSVWVELYVLIGVLIVAGSYLMKP